MQELDSFVSLLLLWKEKPPESFIFACRRDCSPQVYRGAALSSLCWDSRSDGCSARGDVEVIDPGVYLRGLMTM